MSLGGADPSRTHARSLRVLLEKLDDLSKSREELVARVNRLAASDDITPRVLKAASAMEQWVNVQPAMFEDILDEELSKYDRFRRQLEDDERKQDELLAAVRVSTRSYTTSFFEGPALTTYAYALIASRDPMIQERHAQFAQSRREDETVKAREHALQSLDLAYHKYKEIVRNLEEGLKASSTP